MSNNVADTTYFSIQAWMVTKLNLKGCERDVYAIIYGYSQDGESDYHGSLGYMAELTGYSKNSICTALKNLTEKELIIKTEKEINNIKFCRYQINRDSIQSTCTPVQSTCTPVQSTCTNNNIDNNTDNKKNNSKELLQNSTSFEFGRKPAVRESLYRKCISLIDNYTIDVELRKALVDYLKVRLEIKDKPIYLGMWKGLLNKLDREFDSNERLAVVRQSIERGYASFFPVNSTTKDKPWEHGVKSEGYTEEEKRQIEKEREEMTARGERVWY